jgi:cyclic dehypoxanthinyl futalosine synthase
MNYDDILEKVRCGERVTGFEACELFRTAPLLRLGVTANYLTQQKHPEPIVTYIVDRNINYTNICISQCHFCAFYRYSDHREAYLLEWSVLEKKINETLAQGGTQILMQGGLHPQLNITFFEELLSRIKTHFPEINIHGFSPPEIIHMVRQSGLSVPEILARLKAAGLGSIPGGGAEILSDRVRKLISPNKCTSHEWLLVMEEAHELGLRTTATMMYGHIETIEERIDHLIKLRDLQDKTRGFTAFIPWSFQPSHTLLGKQKSSFAFDYLKTLAISRIVLDNFANIQASWVTQGPKIAQIALFFGANDLGSTMLEENVVRAAGVSFCLAESDLRRLITDIGLIPCRRNTFYEVMGI